MPAIKKLTEEKLQVRLAVSLHTPDDELRNTLVPVNTKWDVAEVLEAARAYADQTGRRVSIEYALIRDINDQGWRADLLGKKLRKYLGQLGAREPDPVEPDAGQQVGRVAEAGGAGVRAAGSRAGCRVHCAGHAWAGDRGCLRSARCRRLKSVADNDEAP